MHAIESRPGEIRGVVLARYVCARDNDGGDGARPSLSTNVTFYTYPAAFDSRAVSTDTDGDERRGVHGVETKRRRREQDGQPSNDAQFS